MDPRARRSSGTRRLDTLELVCFPHRASVVFKTLEWVEASASWNQAAVQVAVEKDGRRGEASLRRDTS